MTTYQTTPDADHRFGLCDQNWEGFTFHKTAEDRDAHAKKAIKEYISSEGEWCDDVTAVFAFFVTHVATATNIRERKGKLDDDGYDEEGKYWQSADFDYTCNYELQEFPAKAES